MRAGRKGEFSPGERMFVCQLKLAGNSFPNILRKFQERFGKTAPCRSAMNAMAAKKKTKFTVWNLRKGNSGLKKTVRTPPGDCFSAEISGESSTEKTWSAWSISKEKSSESVQVLL